MARNIPVTEALRKMSQSERFAAIEMEAKASTLAEVAKAREQTLRPYVASSSRQPPVPPRRPPADPPNPLPPERGAQLPEGPSLDGELASSSSAGPSSSAATERTPATANVTEPVSQREEPIREPISQRGVLRVLGYPAWVPFFFD